MPDNSASRQNRLFAYALGAAVLYYLGFHLSKWVPLADDLDLKYDAILRLELVRNLLGPGTWYDNTLPDVLPPDGFNSHWSRYLDLILAAMVRVFAIPFSQHTAEVITVTLWPLLVYLGMLYALARFAMDRFGLRVACLTLLGLSLSPLHFLQWLQLGNIDHHGLQLLLATLCLPLLAGTRADARSAALAGLATGLLFTISLDSIFFVALMAFYAGLSWSFGHNDARFARNYLAAFGGSVVVLFLVENPPWVWLDLQCDAVSQPYLVLAIAAGVTGLILPVLDARLRSPWVRLGVFTLCGVAGIAAALPLYGPCAAGPYAMIAPLTYELSLEGHPEVVGMLTVLGHVPVYGLAMTLPLFAGAAALGWRLTAGVAEERWPLILSLLAMLAGLIGASYQMRAMIFAFAPLPLAFALFVDQYLRIRVLQGSPFRMLGLVLVTPVLFVTVLVYAVASGLTGYQPVLPFRTAVVDATHPEECYAHDTLAPLNALPKGVVLSPVDFGARVLAHTHHAVANLNSHRAPVGMDNAVLPFVSDEAELRSRVDRFGVDYVVVCRGAQFTLPGAIGNRLSAGDAPDWLEPVAVDGDRLYVYRVRPGGAGS